MRKKNCLGLCAVAIFLCIGKSATAQSTDSITLSLDQAITIALSENPTIIVSDMEIKRTDYARRESIGGLLPTIDYSGSYSRTLKKQVMYMDPRYGRWPGSRPRQLLVYRLFLVFTYHSSGTLEKPEIIGGATRTIARKCPIFPAFYGRSGKKSLLLHTYG